MQFIPLFILKIIISFSSVLTVPSYGLVERQGITYEINSVTPFTGQSVRYSRRNTIEEMIDFQNGQREGWSFIFYGNGEMKSGYSYKEGQLDGVSAQYYFNGQLKEETHYQNGQREGKSVTFHENGKVESSQNYNNGEPIGSRSLFYESGNPKELTTNNQLDGIKILFYKNGQLSESKKYKDGKLDGDTTLFYENGKIKAQRKYKNNVLINNKSFIYFENGQLQSQKQEHFNKGHPEGLFEAFYESGELKEKKLIKNRELEGLAEAFYESGELRSRVTYKNGRREGLFEAFYESGELEAQGYYKEGKLDGPRAFFYLNAKCQSIREWTTYEKGKENGFRYKFYENGALQSRLNIVGGIVDGSGLSYRASVTNDNVQPFLGYFYIDSKSRIDFCPGVNENNNYRALDTDRKGVIPLPENIVAISRLSHQRWSHRKIINGDTKDSDPTCGIQQYTTTYYFNDDGATGALDTGVVTSISLDKNIEDYYSNGTASWVIEHSIDKKDSDKWGDGNAVVTTFFESGQIMSQTKFRFRYQNNTKRRTSIAYLLHGQSVEYWQNGKLRDSYFYENGLRSGERNFFDSSGNSSLSGSVSYDSEGCEIGGWH